MKQSKWLLAVMKVLRKIYPTSPWMETNLYNLIRGIELPEELKLEIKRYHVDLRKMRVDLWVPGQIAIEVHGEQHEKPVLFSKQILDPEEELERRKHLDHIKEVLLTVAGIPHVTIWWHEIESLTEDTLRQKITDAQKYANRVPKQQILRVKPSKFRTRKESFEHRKEVLEKQKAARRAAYQRAKARRENNGI